VLNLPPEIRPTAESLILLGIIPGDKAPKSLNA
jgi:hypothetical protein